MAALMPPPSAGRAAVALIAHDAKKADLVAFAAQHKAELERFQLIGTGTTGGRVAEATGLTVQRFLSGPLGGDAQIAALAATGQVAAVLFFIDPLSAHPHEPDIGGLLRVCNVHNVALATNLATAEAVVAALVAAAAAAGPQ